MLSRRGLVGALGGLALLAGSPIRAGDDPAPGGPSGQSGVVKTSLFDTWRAGWERMEEIVRRRGWGLTELEIDDPAEEEDVRSFENRHGVSIPPQLRDLLVERSAAVKFGWSIPALYRPFEGLNLPVTGGMRDLVFSLTHIDEEALSYFESMKSDQAGSGDGEEPNRPEMWEKQFAFAHLDNGDVLTVDVSSPDGPQPIRYFSIDLEGLHHHVIAPDFLSFVTAYTALGCAGSDQDDWFRFVDTDGEQSLLDPDGEGGRRWRAWLDRDPEARDPDEPPRPVPAKTRSDFNLLDAGAIGSRFGVEAALAAGAKPDCVDGDMPNRKGTYDITFETALVYALRRGDREAVEHMLAAGATLDTRLLSVSEAISASHEALVPWLLEHGARANGWKGDRNWPLFLLLTGRGAKKPFVTDPLPTLKLLLDHGADPNARTQDDRTMAMVCGLAPLKVLLDHGADPKLYDHDGDTALHLTESVEAARALVAHGADPNALTQPPAKSGVPRDPPHTPYQLHLRASAVSPERRAVANVLVTLGADPLKHDGLGRSTLWYCRTLADAKRLVALGCDPRERGPDGDNLLFELVRWYGQDLAHDKNSIALLTYFRSSGLDINARDRGGGTILHLAAQRDGAADVALLLKLGADKTIRDRDGKRPADLVTRNDKQLQALLRP